MKTEINGSEREIDLAQIRFLDGYEVPAGLISDSARKSWERLRRSGLRPDARARFDYIDLQTASSEDARTRTLIACAEPEMDALHHALNSTKSTVLCVDPAGFILTTRQLLADGKASSSPALRPGQSVRENDVGTNAPACVIADHRPLLIRRGEHYLNDLKNYVCAGAPIFDPTGELAGVLNVSSAELEQQPSLLDHVKLAARAIENRLFRSLPNVKLLQFHFMPDLVSTVAQGLIAVTPDKSVLGINFSAFRMLGISHDDARRLMLDDIFENSGSMLNATDLVEVRSCRSGQRYCLRELSGEGTTIHHPTPPKHRKTNPGRTDNIDDDRAAFAFTAGAKALTRNLPLMIRGETGTGKEVLARAVHDAHDASAPFIAVNCSAIPEALMESELFGYNDGAFTGARKGGQPGAFQQAHGGTLFLDEIGDATLTLQAKLLRVLQEGVISRLGGGSPVRVDVRVISATHRDIAAMIAQGTFREDLFYRLNGLTVTLPPLRDRRDKGAIIDRLLTTIAMDGSVPTLSDDARRHLITHVWPGNIRQMRQVLAAAAALADDPCRISLDDVARQLSQSGDAAAPTTSSGPDLAAMQLDVIRETLRATKGNVAAASRRLNISRTTIYNHLRRDVNPP